MARSQPVEAPERPIDDMVRTETVAHRTFGDIHIGATVDGEQVWSAWGDRVPTIRLRESYGPDRPRARSQPSRIDDMGTVVQFDKWEHLIRLSSLFPIPHRRWLGREVRFEGRRYVRRAHGSGSVIERDGHGVVLSAERRMYKRDPWPGQLTPLADSLDAPLALVWDRAIDPSGLTFFS